MTPIVGVLLVLTLADGDTAFQRIDYRSAAAIYDSVLTTSADPAAVLWRLARLYVCMADVAPEESRDDIYREAENYARRSILADSSVGQAHTWLAAALGNLAMREGARTKVMLCREIKAELDRAIILDPGDDIAYSILGSFYLALGNVSWIERQLAAIFLGGLPQGGLEESEQALRKAIALAPGVVRHHFELGRVYLAEDRKEEARHEFEQSASLPATLASDHHTQASAREEITLLDER